MLIFKILVRAIAIALILGTIGYHIYVVYYFFARKAPYVGSFNSHLKVMKELKLQKGKKIVDLGCGDGKALRFFVRQFGLKTEGYDINRFAIMIGRLKSLRINPSLSPLQGRTVRLYNKKFETADLQKYDYIYLYLWDSQLAKMEDWIFDAIRDDAIVISNTFQFKKHQPFEIMKDKKGKGRIFLYRK